MNIVFLFSDEHAGAVMRNSGHPVVQTPHLDRWAWRNDMPPPEATVRCALASYYALVSSLDAQIGRILAAIDTSRLRETVRPRHPNNSGLGLYGKSFRQHRARLCWNLGTHSHRVAW